MKNAFAIGHITVKNEAKWSEYRSRLPATLEPWGGEVMFRGRLVSVLSGDHQYTATVVLRFPDLQALNGWHSSPQYQALVPIRQEAADVVLLAYEE